MPFAIRFTLKFALTLAACTLACTVLWGCFVTDVAYHCTDAVGLDFLQARGNWVHGDVAGQPGSYGDTIRQGWTIDRLNALWYSVVAVNFIASAMSASIPWKMRGKLEEAPEFGEQ